MFRLAIIFLVGATTGYTVGYRQGESGGPSLKQRALEIVGVYKVKDDHLKRQQVIEQLQQARQDSIESAIHKANAPH
ncbi:MAG: hypothetical protein V4550_06565 [Gemmatimonadota bacterium]